MATIGVYDDDFFKYENIIPNIDCCKIVAYERSVNNVATLTPYIAPHKYSHFYIRKDYNDGNFNKKFFEENCTYGGRAFNNGKYVPLPDYIEGVLPDVSIYKPYEEYFCSKKVDKKLFDQLLNSVHIRLLDKNNKPYSPQYLCRGVKKYSRGFILHDTNLVGTNGLDIIKEIQKYRFPGSNKVQPYPIGSKYPINIYNPHDLNEWLNIPTTRYTFSLTYHGLMDDDVLTNLYKTNPVLGNQIWYDVTYGYKNEDDFLHNILPNVFLQILYLRRNGYKILLIDENNFLKTKQTVDFITMLNSFVTQKWLQKTRGKQSLYIFCKNCGKSISFYKKYEKKRYTLTIKEMQEVFQYIRGKNYDLFCKFYELDKVGYKKGGFIDEWTGDFI